MSTAALDQFLAQHSAHAERTQRLDERLANWHGITWADFVLLDALDGQGGAMPLPELAQRLATSRSRLLAQVLPLEKLGWLSREAAEGGARRLSLLPSGQRLVHAARESAADLCARMSPV